jgi:hypothetical protein
MVVDGQEVPWIINRSKWKIGKRFGFWFSPGPRS